MAAALLRGELDAAWHFNGAVLVLGPLIGVAVGYQILAWALDRIGWVKLPRLRMGPRAVRLVTTALLGVLLVFGVLRNL